MPIHEGVKPEEHVKPIFTQICRRFGVYRFHTHQGVGKRLGEELDSASRYDNDYSFHKKLLLVIGEYLCIPWYPKKSTWKGFCGRIGSALDAYDYSGKSFMDHSAIFEFDENPRRASPDNLKIEYED